MKKTHQPRWEDEFRALVHEEIKREITGQKKLNSAIIWSRNPLSFVDSESNKKLHDCWKFFPDWLKRYDSTSRKGSLGRSWGALVGSTKKKIALAFKNHSSRQLGATPRK
ncbi:MAG: hypothetical protein A2845_01930 [Candidatus Lloydbacteria bacterium RIFCSPHIGHO2_01_FULL_49_22]|uniref:Uncharacterized protein n=1 Tax=Candidatus Lloydbacteria bacterium RIFCSPHIGHO2_01_FULL_49_22 TaxID=1798658 RepID=A0A1G2CUI2_9BACT|nr:MAG: hypothetical protein A2845_01930 [Candidatus Lloydbacteria bacterium RIFCSPHIGHO2_01_FULL_49_22]OGZ09602.1 MAG: hypothetical protein A3C14_05905 [Candidatus Lloydbacteria bacterium RIFCSPHIGHO2_02_FULL_50_18]